VIRISHPLRLDTPLYPGTPGPEVVPFCSLAAGDSSNASLFLVHSHSGTHLDAPRHFCPDGATVADLCGGEIVLEPVISLDIATAADARIGPEHIQSSGGVPADIRGLLLRTGWSRYRETDSSRYLAHNPWIDPDLPAWLREEYPELRLFGTDTISIATASRREEGRACHRAFLCEKPPILLLEDLDLTSATLPGRRLRLRIIPWIVAPVDGVPVTAFLVDTGRSCEE